MYKKVSVKQSQSWIKSVFLCWWFSFDLYNYLILDGANNDLHSSIKKIKHSVESGTSKKVLR